MTELPPSLHTSVNSARSNVLIEAMTMSDTSEPWSLPWHALQRTLARGFGVEAATCSPPGCRVPAAKSQAAAEAASWLVRARIAALSPPALPHR
jgi:hypothetical protein